MYRLCIFNNIKNHKIIISMSVFISSFVKATGDEPTSCRLLCVSRKNKNHKNQNLFLLFIHHDTTWTIKAGQQNETNLKSPKSDQNEIRIFYSYGTRAVKMSSKSRRKEDTACLKGLTLYRRFNWLIKKKSGSEIEPDKSIQTTSTVFFFIIFTKCQETRRICKDFFKIRKQKNPWRASLRLVW